jgi:hypothetical protein
MARPRAADRVDGLQIRRVAANILNKQSWTVDKGWSYGPLVRGLGKEITTLRRKILTCLLHDNELSDSIKSCEYFNWATTSFSKRTLLHGLSEWISCFWILPGTPANPNPIRILYYSPHWAAAAFTFVCVCKLTHHTHFRYEMAPSISQSIFHVSHLIIRVLLWHFSFFTRFLTRSDRFDLRWVVT